jgi:hypothetical protein
MTASVEAGNGAPVLILYMLPGGMGVERWECVWGVRTVYIPGPSVTVRRESDQMSMERSRPAEQHTSECISIYICCLSRRDIFWGINVFREDIPREGVCYLQI